VVQDAVITVTEGLDEHFVAEVLCKFLFCSSIAILFAMPNQSDILLPRGRL